MDIQRTLGRIEQKVDGNLQWMTKHVADDAKVADAVIALQVSHAKQRGFMSALGVVGSVLGAGIGYLVERWVLKH